MATYTYALTAFPAGLDVDRFLQEVRDSSITVAVASVDTDTTNAYVNFKASLSGGEEATLSALVASHSGEPLDDGRLRVVVDEKSDRTLSGVQEWDRTAGGVLVPPSGVSFPGSPVVGEVFLRTDEAKWYRRGASSWVELGEAPTPPVSSVFGRTGAVVAEAGDYTPAQVGADPLGSASAAVAVHVAAGDPHTQYTLRSERGASNGHASLDASALVPLSEIPVISDTKHGSRGGGSLHSAATPSANGFLSSADKTKLDTVETGAQVNYVRQVVSARVSVNTTTTSTTYVALLSASVTVNDGRLLVHFSTSCSNSSANRQLFFEVRVDGTLVGRASVRVTGANNPDFAQVLAVVPVAAGAREVTVNWRVSANTGQIRPTTAEEHAVLVVTEMAA